MNGYESSDIASDTDEWEESLGTGEYHLRLRMDPGIPPYASNLV